VLIHSYLCSETSLIYNVPKSVRIYVPLNDIEILHIIIREETQSEDREEYDNGLQEEATLG
jgi:hypothetical protein